MAHAQLKNGALAGHRRWLTRRSDRGRRRCGRVPRTLAEPAGPYTGGKVATELAKKLPTSHRCDLARACNADSLSVVLIDERHFAFITGLVVRSATVPGWEEVRPTPIDTRADRRRTSPSRSPACSSPAHDTSRCSASRSSRSPTARSRSTSRPMASARPSRPTRSSWRRRPTTAIRRPSMRRRSRASAHRSPRRSRPSPRPRRS